jgi:hypothetical protein
MRSILTVLRLLKVAQRAERTRKVGSRNVQWSHDTLSDHLPVVLCVDMSE